MAVALSHAEPMTVRPSSYCPHQIEYTVSIEGSDISKENPAPPNALRNHRYTALQRAFHRMPSVANAKNAFQTPVSNNSSC